MEKRGSLLVIVIMSIAVILSLIFAFYTINKTQDDKAIEYSPFSPGAQFAKANDTKRQSDINMFLNAVSQYIAVNNGNEIPTVTEEEQKIAKSGADLCSYILPEYVPALPVDPSMNSSDIMSCEDEYDTGYTIKKNKNRTYTIKAPLAETNSLTVTR